jgi:hypothetical protein
VSHSWGEAFEDFALTLHRLLDEEVIETGFFFGLEDGRRVSLDCGL